GPAPSPELAGRIASLTIDIDLAELRARAGQSPAVATQIDRLEPELRRLGHAPLLAQALYVRGIAAENAGDSARARSALIEAAQLAPAAGDELLEVMTATRLVYDATADRPDLALARTWVAAAEQALIRARGHAVAPHDIDRMELAIAG